MTTTNSNQNPKRRWLAFRLRTLFVLVAIASVPMAWVGYQLNWGRERRRVVSLLTRKASTTICNSALWSLAVWRNRHRHDWLAAAALRGDRLDPRRLEAIISRGPRRGIP